MRSCAALATSVGIVASAASRTSTGTAPFTFAFPSIAAMVIAANRAGDLDTIATDVSRHASEARERELAEVYVAAPLDDARREQLREALERATGKKLDLKVFVDESIVGGVRAKIGDTVIDGSLARRLDEVRTRIGS